MDDPNLRAYANQLEEQYGFQSVVILATRPNPQDYSCTQLLTGMSGNYYANKGAIDDFRDQQQEMGRESAREATWVQVDPPEDGDYFEEA